MKVPPDKAAQRDGYEKKDELVVLAGHFLDFRERMPEISFDSNSGGIHQKDSAFLGNAGDCHPHTSIKFCLTRQRG